MQAVGKDLSDKELRVLMRENKIMINNLNPVTGPPRPAPHAHPPCTLHSSGDMIFGEGSSPQSAA